MYKLLFLTQRPFYPDTSGGAQQSALHLFKSLRQLGWQVEAICARRLRSLYFWDSCWQSLKHFRIPFPVALDETLGFPCWRVISKLNSDRKWLEFLDQRLQQYQPDVVLGHSPPTCSLLNYAVNLGYNTFYIARSTGHFEDGYRVPDGVHLLANSPYTASVIAQLTGHKPEVILPLIEQESYRVSHSQSQYITFINPIPEKGLNVVVEIARQLPQEKFLFVKGKWVAYIGKQNSILETVSIPPNVEVWEHQEDMRKIYAVTDILLVPSQYNETFGRVIVEAQINGIPVVAAYIAGIPYTLGKGGILVAPCDNIQAYVDAIRQLRTDKNFYTEISSLALQNSQRPEFNSQYQVGKFVQFVEHSIKVKQQTT